MEYEPGHPDANGDGYVEYPNVEVIREMVDLMAAARDASLGVLEDAAAADPSYKKVYDVWKKARTDAFRWFGRVLVFFLDRTEQLQFQFGRPDLYFG